MLCFGGRADETKHGTHGRRKVVISKANIGINDVAVGVA